MASCRLKEAENEEAEEEEEDIKKDLSDVDPELLTTIKVLRHVVARDPLAADLQLSLFSSAVFSQRYTSVAQPLPREYDRPGGNHDLIELLEEIPPLRSLVEGSPSVALARPTALYLLRWLLTPVGPPPPPPRSSTTSFPTKPQASDTSLVEVPEFAPSALLRAMPRPPSSQDGPTPNYLFEVIHPILDDPWRDMAQGKKIVTGFIGGPLDTFFSTVHCGVRPGGNMMKIHRNLQDAMEDSTQGCGSSTSELGALLLCVAEVECVMEVPGLAVAAAGKDQHLVLRDGKLARVSRLHLFKCDEDEPPPNWSQAWQESAAKGMAARSARSLHNVKSTQGAGTLLKLPEFKFEVELGGDQQKAKTQGTGESHEPSDSPGPSDAPGGPGSTPPGSAPEGSSEGPSKDSPEEPAKDSPEESPKEAGTDTPNDDENKDSLESVPGKGPPSSKRKSKCQKKLKLPAPKSPKTKKSKNSKTAETPEPATTEVPSGQTEAAPTPPRYQAYRPKAGSTSRSIHPTHAPRPADGTVLEKEVRQEPTCVASFTRSAVSGDASQKTIYYGPYDDSNDWKSQEDAGGVKKGKDESVIDSFVAREQPGPSPEEIEEIRCQMQRILIEPRNMHDISNYESALTVFEQEQLVNVESSSSCIEEIEIVREETVYVREDFERTLMKLLTAHQMFNAYRPMLQNDPLEIHSEETFSVHRTPSLMAEELRKEMNFFVTQYSAFEFTSCPRASEHEVENQQPEIKKISPTKCPNRSPFTIAEGQRSEEKESFVREIPSSEFRSDSDEDSKLSDKLLITVSINYKEAEKNPKQEVQDPQLQVKETFSIPTDKMKLQKESREEKREIKLEETHPASNSNGEFKNFFGESRIQIKEEPEDTVSNGISQTVPKNELSNELAEKEEDITCHCNRDVKKESSDPEKEEPKTCYAHKCHWNIKKELSESAEKKEDITCYCTRNIKKEMSDQAIVREEQITSYSHESNSKENNKHIVVTKAPVPMDSSSESEVLSEAVKCEYYAIKHEPMDSSCECEARRHPLDDLQDIESTLSSLTTETASARFPESTHESEEDIHAQIRHFALESPSEIEDTYFENMTFCPRCLLNSLTFPAYNFEERENQRRTEYCGCNRRRRPKHGRILLTPPPPTVVQVPVVSSRYMEGLIMAMFVWAIVSLFYTGRNDSGYGII